MLAACLIAVAFLAFMVVRDRQVARERERWVALVEGLCQRVQAPELAVVAHDRGDVENPKPVNEFDDADYFEVPA